MIATCPAPFSSDPLFQYALHLIAVRALRQLSSTTTELFEKRGKRIYEQPGVAAFHVIPVELLSFLLFSCTLPFADARKNVILISGNVLHPYLCAAIICYIYVYQYESGVSAIFSLAITLS